jgi:hypothetical protein
MACEAAEGVKKEWAEVLNPTNPRIVAVQSEDGMSGFDYQVDVFCTIRNDGGPGYITVIAHVTKGGFWEKEETIHFAEKASHTLTFNFTEPSLIRGGLSSGDYGCDFKTGDSPDQSSSPAAAPKSPSRNQNQPTAVQQRQAPRKTPPTALPRQGKPVERPTLTKSQQRKSQPAPTNVPGKVNPEQVAGEFVSVSNPGFSRGGSDELVVVTFTNTSKVVTHYHITGDHSGAAYRNGWRIIDHNGIRCSTISEKQKKFRGGLGTCREKDVYPGDEVEVHYTVRSPATGSASITWILTASHTCGAFGCREKEVDRISETFSVSNR